MTKSVAVRVGVHEAKTRLSELLRLVDSGREIEIARGGEPVAELVPFHPRETRQLGIDRGVFTVPEDFDAPLPGDVLESFHRCDPGGPAACGVGGIGAGGRRGVVSLSVSFRKVRGMSERRFRRTPGGVCSRGLHLVWCPKYRRRILGGRVAARCAELLEQIADEHGWEIVAKEVMPDHVHLFVRVGPTDAPAAVVRAFKGRTARVLRADFPYLRRFAKVFAKVLWSPSYFAASVGYVSETTVRRYIEHQWDAVA